MLRTANKQLQPQGKLKYVIKDIEGCFPNMPKDAIRTSMKTVLEEMDRRTVRVGRVFLSREHKTVDAHDKHHGVIKAESGSRPLFCSRHRYVLLRQCDLVETQRRIASTEAGNPHGGPSVPRDDNCGVCVDGTHVADRTLPLREGEIDQQSAMDDIGGAREGGGGGDGGEGGGKGGGEGGGEGSGWPSTAASMPRLAPSQAWGAGAAAEALPVQGMREPQQGALVRSGGASRGGSDVRIRLGRHAHGEGPGRSRSGPTSIHSRGQAE